MKAPNAALDMLATLVNLHDGIDDGGEGITEADWEEARALEKKERRMNHITQKWSRDPSSPHSSFNPVEIFATFDQGPMPPARCVVARIYSWSGYGPENNDRRKREASEMADRVIASVNACADMVDPATQIPELIDVLTSFVENESLRALGNPNEPRFQTPGWLTLMARARKALAGHPVSDPPQPPAPVERPSHPQEAEVRSLLEYLVNAGFRLADVITGGEDDTPISTLEEALEEILSVDSSWLHVTHPSNGTTKLCIYIVLGNEPGVVVNDYSNSPLLDGVIEAHSKYWDEEE